MTTVNLYNTAGTVSVPMGISNITCPLVDVESYVANDKWNLLRLPVGVKVIASGLEVVEKASEASTADVGFNGSDEFLNGTDLYSPAAGDYVNTVAGTAPDTTYVGTTDATNLVTFVLKTGSATGMTAGQFRVHLTLVRV